MTKLNKIIYWVSTIWLSLGMLSTGVVQILRMEQEVNNFTNLGFPSYLLTYLGVWKILGVVTVLIPKFRILKEWAYAGFFFSLTGAVYSHIAVGHAIIEMLPALLLLTLTLVSWYFRPANRKYLPPFQPALNI